MYTTTIEIYASKKSTLTQIEMNQIATQRLVQEVTDWETDWLSTIFNPLNKKLGVNISTLEELQALSATADAEKYAQVLDDILDEIASNDGFGTEQQCDPRGDFRDQDWSMWNVQE